MFRNILRSGWFTAAAAVVAGFLLISLIKIEPVLVTTRNELKNLDKKIAEVERLASELERLGDYAKSDGYLERQARLKLNYKKPDEKVVYVYNTQAGLTKEAGGASENPEVFNSKLILNLKSWWQYLLGN